MHVSVRFAIPVLLLSAGCTWYPYNPYYGNGGYSPGYMQPGGYPAAPGPTYIPQNGPILNAPASPSSPTLINPGSPTQPNWSPNTTPNTTPNNSNDAPRFDVTPPNNPVPLPRDSEFFGTPPGAAAIVRPPALASRSSVPANGAAPVQPAGLKTDDPFLEPARLSADSDAQPMPTESTPYGYDGSGYTWLKGIVDFDEETKTWAIIYSLTPDRSDQFGGTLVLGPSDSLRDLQPGDLVVMTGQPDAKRRDSRGLPVYHATKATLVGRRSER